MKIIINIGDCNGIGIEIMLKAIELLDYKKDLEISIAGNTKTIQEYIEKISYDAQIENGKLKAGKYLCPIIECDNYSPVQFGVEDEKAGRLAAEAIETAVDKYFEEEFDAIVTMPVSKSSLYKAGWQYPGHTEMLAARSNVKDPLMILCTDKIRVGLVTIHIPLQEVSSSINKDNLLLTALKFNKSLIKDFGINQPKLAVLGLNPHAGENGGIGKEEIDLIIPSIEEMRLYGVNAFGPFPSDGFFAYDEYLKYDGILAMYHDQGLIPLKLLAKGEGVNVTAGLPIVRTSPDHGTAFPIAGKNIADPVSALKAITMAIHISNSRNNYYKGINK